MTRKKYVDAKEITKLSEKQIRKLKVKKNKHELQGAVCSRTLTQIGSNCSTLQVKIKFGEKQMRYEGKLKEWKSVEKYSGTKR